MQATILTAVNNLIIKCSIRRNNKCHANVNNRRFSQCATAQLSLRSWLAGYVCLTQPPNARLGRLLIYIRVAAIQSVRQRLVHLPKFVLGNRGCCWHAPARDVALFWRTANGSYRTAVRQFGSFHGFCNDARSAAHLQALSFNPI